jgi:putative CocE/NonD family hydrolase
MHMISLKKLRRTSDLFLVCFLLLAVFLSSVNAQERISRPGQYKGYSQPIYEEWVRSSQYITVRDGTKLAVDIFRPARDGNTVSEPLPAVWTHDRYHRASIHEGKLVTEVDQSPWLQQLLKHGYIVGVVDVRGGGASYGTRQGPFAQEESRDAYDVTEWLAAQPWCDGNIGMFGRSYLGITQYFAASTSPPHLKAIFPEMAMFDLYPFTYPGGVLHHDFVTQWGRLTRQLDTVVPVAPVDADSDGSMLKQAIAEHAANLDIKAMAEAIPFRNSHDGATNSIFGIARSPSSYIHQIRESGVAIYHWAGWYDVYSRDALLWFHNLDNPQKLTIGPWSHTGGSGLMVTEHLRWYDYWLKGIENGVMEEAPIFYHVMGAPEGSEWRTVLQWPLLNEEPTSYYFVAGPTGTVDSVNDGSLSTRPPTGGNGKDTYVVDYTTTSGKATRWTNGYGGGFEYPDMSANDAKGVTYTSSALDSDTEVTGHPIVHLWVSSTAEDGDFFVYLEEVDKQGVSHYITEGTLRASHRVLSEPPFDYLGLPYHRSFEEDVVALPQEPVELFLDLHPTSNLFDVGHRIRVTVTCSDRDNALTPELQPSPTVTMYRNSDYPSHIVLPIIPAGAAE